MNIRFKIQWNIKSMKYIDKNVIKHHLYNQIVRNVLGCTFEDVEFVGGDLSKAQGGGGVTIRYDDECIIACEENPRCKYVLTS